MKPPFRSASHTIVLSDIHISDAEPVHKHRPLWKRYKRKRFFIDRSFRRFLEYMQSKIEGPIELVLNGDIFDFDSVLAQPQGEEASDSHLAAGWLEKRRGLNAEEEKSRFKMRTILKDHSTWVESIRKFILAGNRVVFIVGNHDMELHWPGVQQEILDALKLSGEFRDSVRFCEWFYVSNQDTLIEHGNQYDAYCLCSNPIHPLIKKGSRIYVRQPFGNLANKYMMNGMGLFNPHVESNYIMTATQYVAFFFRYMLRTQPLLIWTWFWGAMITLFTSIGEGLLPALKDPLTVESRISQIATRSNASPRVVRSLREIHVHPAIHDHFQILRELWLDRAFLFVLICFASFQIFSVVHLFARVSLLWFCVPLLFFLPFFLFYASSVKSNVFGFMDSVANSAPLAAKICKVKRVIHGHTHIEQHRVIEGVELINTGAWSPSFLDPECRRPFGRKPFAWIRPAENGKGRIATLHEWLDPDTERVIPIDGA